MSKMEVVICVLCLVLIAGEEVTAYANREAPRQLFTNGCPVTCECSQTDCVYDDEIIDCSTTTIICHNGIIDDVVAEMPKNVTSNLISGDRTTMRLDLGNLRRLKKLVFMNFRGNNFEELIVSRSMRRLLNLKLAENHIRSLPLRELLRLRRLEFLDLSRNKIESVGGVRFPLQLRKLILDDNLIEEITKGDFQNLEYLEKLSIANNKIKLVDRRALHLVFVEILVLRNNSMEELQGTQFYGMPMLWYLDLSYNHIYELHPSAFMRLGRQTDLPRSVKLEHNKIRYLDEKQLEKLLPFGEYIKLFLAGNPLYCDCEMMRLRNEAGELFADVNRATCASPPESNGVILQDLYIDLCCENEDELYTLYEDEDLELYDYD